MAGPASDLQELGLSEMAYVQELGELQATVVGGFQKVEDTEVLNLDLSVEFGVTDRFQLGVELPTAVPLGTGEESAEIEHVVLGAGWSVVRASGFVLTPMVEMAVGSEPRIETMLVAHQIIERLHLNLQLGVEVGTRNAEVIPEGAVGLYAAFGPLTPVVEMAFEVEGEFEGCAAAGLAWRPTEGYEMMLTGIASIHPWLDDFGGLLTLLGEWELVSTGNESTSDGD